MIYESFPSLDRFVQVASQSRIDDDRHADYVFHGWGVEHELAQTSCVVVAISLNHMFVCVSSELSVVINYCVV